MSQNQQYKAKICGKIELIQDVDKSLDKIIAAAKKLDKRGEFPKGLVTQPDILALRSVILTTGRPGNLNDDVMLNEEVLPVLWTAALKPFNIEHTKFIIGTMFDAFAVNKETGDVVESIDKYDEDMDDEERAKARAALLEKIGSMPENLDIITNAVIWALHFPQESRDIKRKAIQGELFVSMEVWFADYDYLVGNRIVKRTPEIAEMFDAKLRINGGSGYVGLDKIKRVPRNLTFAGNAVVETPANPESFILDVMDRADMSDEMELEVELEDEMEDECEHVEASIQKLIAENTIKVLESLSDEGANGEELDAIGEIGRSGSPLGIGAQDSESEVAEVGEVVSNSEETIMEKLSENEILEAIKQNVLLSKNLEETQASLAEVNKAKDELNERATELEAQLAEKVALIEEKEAELAAKAEALEKLESENKELTSKFDELNAKLIEIEEARKLEARKAALTDIGLSEERIVKVIAKTAELDDEAFASEVEDIKAFMSELSVTKAETEEVETEEVVPEVDEATAEETVEEEQPSEEEIAEVLEEAEEEEVPEAAAVGSAADGGSDLQERVTHAMAKALGIRLGS